MLLDKGKKIQFTYTNWKGESSVRKAFVFNILWGSNEWHKEEQWLLFALDEDKRESRYFAMKDMKDVQEIEKIKL
jgi:predicted DNA-binding transcriptional regulator YafY